MSVFQANGDYEYLTTQASFPYTALLGLPIRHVIRETGEKTPPAAPSDSSMPFRTTGKPEDEVICLTSLLRCDYEAKRSLFKVDVQDRMRAFLLSPSLGRIPQDILVAQWPKMHTDGLCWAPTSFTRVTTGDRGLGSFFMGNGIIQAQIG